MLTPVRGFCAILHSMGIFGPPPTPPGIARIERKLDLLLAHLEIDVPDALSPRVRAAMAANRKIEAIKLHREETGLGLREAKDQIEAEM